MNVRRRTLLRAIGAGALTLPLLPERRSQAGGGATPRRLVVVHFAHGVARDRWSPSVGEGVGEGAGELELSEILAPLAEHADRITVVEGLANAAGQSQLGDAHNIAVGTLLTSTPLHADLGPGGHYLPGGPSIEQVLAPALIGEDAVPWSSLQLGVRTHGFALSARGLGQPLPAEDDPVAVHARLFGELMLTPAAREHRYQQRTAARQFARGRLDALTDALPDADRAPLLAHREALDAVQGRQDTWLDFVPDCSIPEPPSPVPSPSTPADADVPVLVRAQTELLVAALACDLTRVVTLQWGSSGNDGLRHVWQGIDQEFHTLAHLANGEDDQAHESLAQMNTWTMGELAHLLARLRAVPDGEGTLLDHTLVVALSGLSVAHHMGDLPVVLAGGGLAGGRVLSYGAGDGDVSLTALWRGLAEHLGAPLAEFGAPEHDPGPLDGL